MIELKLDCEWPGGSESLRVKSGETLVNYLRGASLVEPNLCLRGDCQKCACHVIKGQFADQRPAQSQTYHLACQIIPISDMKVRLFEDPHEMREEPRFIPAKIVKLKALCNNVIGMDLVLPRNQRFTFSPGQYVNIKIKSGITRSYSIVGYDIVQHIVSFHIRLIKGGLFSEWLQAANSGDLVQLYGPLGRFFLKNNVEKKQTVFAATGTGIAPIYCILSSIISEGSGKLGKILIYWGNRLRSDNYFDNEITDIARQLGADYFSIYSAEDQAAQYRRITDCMPISFDDTQVFAAGHPQMIADLRDLAYLRGLEQAMFHADAFSFNFEETKGS